MKTAAIEHKKRITVSTSLIQTIFRYLLGIFLMLAGISHLTWLRAEFPAQVPKWLPMNEDLVVVLSGIVEIALGGSVIFLARYRVQMGWIAAIFFVAVFPGNLSQYTNHINAFGLDSDTKRFVRLLFQPVLVIWALWATGAWSAWRRKRSVQ